MVKKVDLLVESSTYNRVAVEIKNILGYLGLHYKDTKEKVDFYNQTHVSPLFIAPFLAKNLQDYLEDLKLTSGFYCNISYNVTQYTDDATMKMFYECDLIPTSGT